MTSVLPQVQIIVVPGTWSRGIFWSGQIVPIPRWFAKGGSFHDRLTRELKQRGISFSIEALDWSGANSIRRRDAAGEKLARLIKSSALQGQNNIQLVIGHSHGGNVVARAMMRLETSDANLFACTLATPFLELHPSKLPFWMLPSLNLSLIGFFLLQYHPTPGWQTLSLLGMFLASVLCDVGLAIRNRSSKIGQRLRDLTSCRDMTDLLVPR